jgi:hypothetical protein
VAESVGKAVVAPSVTFEVRFPKPSYPYASVVLCDAVCTLAVTSRPAPSYVNLSTLTVELSTIVPLSPMVQMFPEPSYLYVPVVQAEPAFEATS